VNQPPGLRIASPTADAQETAAVIAAITRFRQDTTATSPPAAIEPPTSQWKKAALLEGVRRQPDQ